ncbi:hypothetical protein IP88_11875 [alpha proteobacterium AAP81b]|nr:hypothetical protein IP88_11875 [alpha proteobacterium AAP81b]
MRGIAIVAILLGLLTLAPARAQDASDGAGEIIVTGTLRKAVAGAPVPAPPPVIGLKRTADSAVRSIEIVSDSREAALRKREIVAMLLDAIERARRDGFSLVTGEFTIVEVTRANWQEQFPRLAAKDDAAAATDEDDEDDDDGDDDEAAKPQPAFADDGSTARLRLKVKARLDGTIGNAEQKLAGFIKSVPVTGRSQIEPRGRLALTIVNPEQYRDEIYRRVAAAAKHAASFYGPGEGLDITGLDAAIAWNQVGNTEVFLYVPYRFSVSSQTGGAGPDGAQHP